MKKKKFNPSETIFHHIADSYEWEFFSIGDQHYSLPLPMILYSKHGLDIFMSSKLHHTEEAHHEEGGEEPEHGEESHGNEGEGEHHGETLKTSVATYIVDHGKISSG